MGYRKKAFRLEIRRGENGGYVARNIDTGELITTGLEVILGGIGHQKLDEYLRPVKAEPKEQKPPEPSPPP